MAGLPQNFAAISNVLPTYNFTDLASGTGFINFYAGKTGAKKLLSNYTFYSEDFVVSFTIADGGDAIVADYDFDVLLNRPLNVQGLCVLNVPVGMNIIHDGTASYAYVIARFRKWDGSTETNICSTTSSTYTFPTTVSSFYNMLAIDLTIPLTHFKVGETIRLTLEYHAWHSHAAPVTSTFYLAADPKNRTTGWDSTGAVPSQVVFQLPVRLNL